MMGKVAILTKSRAWILATSLMAESSRWRVVACVVMGAGSCVSWARLVGLSVSNLVIKVYILETLDVSVALQRPLCRAPISDVLAWTVFYTHGSSDSRKVSR